MSTGHGDLHPLVSASGSPERERSADVSTSHKSRCFLQMKARAKVSAEHQDIEMEKREKVETKQVENPQLSATYMCRSGQRSGKARP